MKLREAAHQALEALEEYAKEITTTNKGYQAIVALREVLVDTQDWNELEALRASLREHMAEIHGLRAAGRQALEALEKEPADFSDWLRTMKAARTALRAALAEKQDENTVQSAGGVHSGISDRADCDVETVTDRHDKEGDKLSLPSAEDTGIQRFTAYRRNMSQRASHNELQKNADNEPQFEGVIWSDGTVTLRWLTACRSHSVWNSIEDCLNIHGHPEYGTVIDWHDGPAPQAWIDRSADTGKTSDHIADTNKMVASVREDRTVEPVAWMRSDRGHVCFHKHPEYVPLYTAPPKREPLTDDEIRKVVDMTIDSVTVSESVTFRFFARAIERAHGIGGEE